ncbi:MAG: ROK family protein [candidate division KSB1 bacterium]|nr:ROK family protein [candidate division KSB1 bacterium]
METLYCGIDIGGTTTNIGLVDANGVIKGWRQILTNVAEGPASLADRVSAIVDELCELDGGRKPAACGIGIPGVVQHDLGVLNVATNFPGWTSIPLTQLFAERMRLPVFIENDANAAAFGELIFGAGRGCRDMLMVTLGTGVGGGLVLDGSIYRGAFGKAGEFGHMSINFFGKKCACGRRGCIEAYIKASALVNSALEIAAEVRDSLIHTCTRESLTSKIIYEFACKGDTVAKQVFHKAGEYLGIGLGNVANLLDLERFVIGGAVSGAGEYLLVPARAKLQEIALANPRGKVPSIVPAELGQAAGVVGAATLAMRQQSITKNH